MTRKIAALSGAFLLILLCLLPACGAGLSAAAQAEAQDGTGGLPPYGEMVPGTSVFNGLDSHAVTELFDCQALPLLGLETPAFWYPRHLATAVIAVDRDSTDAAIDGWKSLLTAGVSVSVDDGTPFFDLLTVSMSFGLEGENFSLKSAAALMESLYGQGRLYLDGRDAPALICFDYQAAAMIKAGRNLEIIVPAEGTLTFEIGLFSREPLALPRDGRELVSRGLRLPGGACDESLYPGAEEYVRAARLADYGHLNRVCEGVTVMLRRSVRHVRLYTSADGYEHQLFALLYLFAVVVWTGSIIRRTMQKGVRRVTLACSGMLVVWVLLRMFKYLLMTENTASRYAWYGFYIFQIGLPLALLWLAWVIDKPENTVKPPKWWLYTAAAGGALLLTVLTNDLHGLVFTMDISTDWSKNYGYGPAYYAILAFIFVTALLSQVIMVRKSRKSPRMPGLLLLPCFYGLLIIYCAAYVLRLPFAWESDVAIVTGVFVLLFIELCMRIGLVPVNTRYRRFFAQSPQKMQIADERGNTVLASALAEPVDGAALSMLMESPDKPILRGEDTLLYADAIPGGMVIWQEDISSINMLHRQIRLSLERLEAANAILLSEKDLRVGLAASRARVALFAELEKEIRQQAEMLAEMLRGIPSAEEERRPYMARVAMLVCYIKRRCNLFFLERASAFAAADELAVYMDELAEFAGFAEINCLCSCALAGMIPLRQATLMYDFFHAVLSWMPGHGGNVMFVQMLHEDGAAVMKLMPSGDMSGFEPGPGLLGEIAAAGGSVTVKPLFDSVGISLSFPEGGNGRA